MNGAELIAAERERQITEEGYTAEHDDGHARDLMHASNAYVIEALYPGENLGVRSWPWLGEYWHPSEDNIRNLVKAGALIAAAIDSLQPKE